MRLSALIVLALVQLAVSAPRGRQRTSSCCYAFASKGFCGTGGYLCAEDSEHGCSLVSSSFFLLKQELKRKATLGRFLMVFFCANDPIFVIVPLRRKCMASLTYLFSSSPFFSSSSQRLRQLITWVSFSAETDTSLASCTSLGVCVWKAAGLVVYGTGQDEHNRKLFGDNRRRSSHQTVGDSAEHGRFPLYTLVNRI